MEREPTEGEREPREDEEHKLLVDPAEAVKQARRKDRESPEGETATGIDEVRESGFGA